LRKSRVATFGWPKREREEGTECVFYFLSCKRREKKSAKEGSVLQKSSAGAKKSGSFVFSALMKGFALRKSFSASRALILVKLKRDAREKIKGKRVGTPIFFFRSHN
jgi:hypothetical protein